MTNLDSILKSRAFIHSKPRSLTFWKTRNVKNVMHLWQCWQPMCPSGLGSLGDSLACLSLMSPQFGEIWGCTQILPGSLNAEYDFRQKPEPLPVHGKVPRWVSEDNDQLCPEGISCLPSFSQKIQGHRFQEMPHLLNFTSNGSVGSGLKREQTVRNERWHF